MKISKYISFILCILLTLTLFTGCEKKGFSLLKPKESTTKEAFDKEAFDREFYRTSVPEESNTEEIPTVTENETVISENITPDKTSPVTSLTEKITELTSVIASTVSEQTTASESTKVLPTAKHVVDTKSDVKETKSDYKYGVVKVDVVSTYYDIYSDGTQVVSDKKTYTRYDASKYKATSTELLPEAKSNMAKYTSEINSAAAIINDTRKESGKLTLALDDDLSQIASVRATEMAYSGKLGSTRPDKTYYTTVYSDLGYKYENAIELTCKGYNTANDAVNALSKKSENVALITDETYKKVGIGVATAPDGSIYWCIEFSD